MEAKNGDGEDFEVAFGVPTAAGAVDDGLGGGVPMDFLEGGGYAKATAPKEGGAEEILREALAAFEVARADGGGVGMNMEAAVLPGEEVGGEDVEVGMEDEVIAKGVQGGCGGEAAFGYIEAGTEVVAARKLLLRGAGRVVPGRGSETGVRGSAFGPELSFAKTLRATEKGNIAIAKFTHSGTQMNDWTPEGTTAKDMHVYPAFIAFVRSAMQELKDQGHSVELAGIFYHAGENDMAFGPYRKQAAKWLQSTVAQSRADLSMPSLKWFVSQQLPPDQKGFNQLDITADLAALAAADKAFIHIKAFDLPPQHEKLVLDTAGVLKLGEVLARAYLGE